MQAAISWHHHVAQLRLAAHTGHVLQGPSERFVTTYPGSESRMMSAKVVHSSKRLQGEGAQVSE